MDVLIGLIIMAIGAGAGTLLERRKWQKATGRNRAADARLVVGGGVRTNLPK